MTYLEQIQKETRKAIRRIKKEDRNFLLTVEKVKLWIRISAENGDRQTVMPIIEDIDNQKKVEKYFVKEGFILEKDEPDVWISW